MPHTDSFGVYSSLSDMKKFSILDSNAAQWSNCQRAIVEEIQTQALAADAPSQAFLSANRAFIKNTDGMDHDLDFNGTTFTFSSMTTYCPSPNETQFFLAQAAFLGFGITQATLADYVATGVVATFFE